MVKPTINIGVKYQQDYEIIDVQDKGKNAVIYVRQTCYTKNEKGVKEKVFYIDRSFFIRGIGGFGFKGNNSSPVISSPPKRGQDTEFT